MRGGGGTTDNPSNESITVSGGKTSLTLAAEDTSVSGGITIVTKDAWTSYIEEVTKAEAEWLSINPSSGNAAGTYTITVTIEPNKTGKTRTARIVIICGTDKITITVEQRAEGDDPTPPTPPAPSGEYKRLASIKSYAEYWSGYDDSDNNYEEMTFTYGTDKRLVEIRNIYNDSDDAGDIVDETVYKIEYFENAMRITETCEDDKDVYDITLNDKGYVSKVKGSFYNQPETTPHSTRNFTFDYDADDRLSKVSWEYDNSRFWFMYTYASGVLSTISTNLSDSTDNNPVGLEAQFGTVANNTMNFDIAPLFLSLASVDGSQHYGADDYVEGVVNLLTFLRLAGKGCDYLPAYGNAYEDMACEVNDMWKYTTPNQRYSESDTYCETEGDGKLEYTFNADNTVKCIVSREKVKKIRHDYDVVVGSEVVDQRYEGWDSENDKPIIVNIYNSWTENHKYTTLGTGENKYIHDFTYAE